MAIFNVTSSRTRSVYAFKFQSLYDKPLKSSMDRVRGDFMLKVGTSGVLVLEKGILF